MHLLYRDVRMPRAQDAQERRNVHSRRRTPGHGRPGRGSTKSKRRARTAGRSEQNRESASKGVFANALNRDAFVVANVFKPRRQVRGLHIDDTSRVAGVISKAQTEERR